VPSTLFTDPELAHVGLTEKEAAARGLEFQVLQVAIIPLTIPRARTTGQMDGLLKAIVEKDTQRILGCTILAAEAGEMIGTVQAVMVAKMPATALRDALPSNDGRRLQCTFCDALDKAKRAAGCQTIVTWDGRTLSSFLVGLGMSSTNSNREYRVSLKSIPQPRFRFLARRE
jgi:hypothetical protein